MKVVIFAGGLGTRMREETEFKPKPMVEIGGMPIVMHLIGIYASQGFKEFIILAGYKASLVKSYFVNLLSNLSDVRVAVNGSSQSTEFLSAVGKYDGLDISVIDTGEQTLTGERLLMVSHLLSDGPFMATYGDGLAPVNLGALIGTHKLGNRLATMTVTQPINRFGIVKLSSDDQVLGFREKPVMEDWINMGFFVFEPNIFNYLQRGESLEEGLLRRLVVEDELSAFKHSGFWQPMDTFREYAMLNELWASGKAPWMV